MAVNGIEIEVGQKWRTRSGDVATVRGSFPTNKPYIWGAAVNGCEYTITDTGHRLDFANDKGDLVELITEPNETPGPVISAETLAGDMLVEMGWRFDGTTWLQDGVKKVSALDVQVAGGHYKNLKIQPVEYIHANQIPFEEGSAIKYLTRWREKGGIKDLEKAKHFIDLIIELEAKYPREEGMT